MHFSYKFITIFNKCKARELTNKCWRGYGEREPSYTAGGNVNWCSHCGGQYVGSLKKFKKKKKKDLPSIPTSNPTPGHISTENQNSERCMHHNVHSSTTYNSQDMETT